MIILKNGSLKPRKFFCLVCGCEFVAEHGEYTTQTVNDVILWYSASCPYCDSSTVTSEPWEEAT